MKRGGGRGRRKSNKCRNKGLNEKGGVKSIVVVASAATTKGLCPVPVKTQPREFVMSIMGGDFAVRGLSDAGVLAGAAPGALAWDTPSSGDATRGTSAGTSLGFRGELVLRWPRIRDLHGACDSLEKGRRILFRD